MSLAEGGPTCENDEDEEYVDLADDEVAEAIDQARRNKLHIVKCLQVNILTCYMYGFMLVVVSNLLIKFN